MEEKRIDMRVAEQAEPAETVVVRVNVLKSITRCRYRGVR